MIVSKKKRYDEVRIESDIFGRNSVRSKLRSFHQNTGYFTARLDTPDTGIINFNDSINIKISVVT